MIVCDNEKCGDKITGKDYLELWLSGKFRKDFDGNYPLHFCSYTCLLDFLETAKIVHKALTKEM